MESNARQHTISQILFWCLVWLLILLALNFETGLDAHFWKRTSLVLVGIAFVVYVNLCFLIPKLYLQKKNLSYLASSAVLIFSVLWIVHSDILPWNQNFSSKNTRIDERNTTERRNNQNEIEINDSYRWMIQNLPPLFIALLGSSLASVGRFASEKEREAISLEKAKLETEVRFLKSQINPHFLFNSLHNIYASTVIQSDQAPEQLLRLSDILRYMLYDSNEERVSLEREVEYLQNYLELAMLKDSRGMDLRFDLSQDHEGLKVAPLLFIPFVENAFKHSKIEDLNNGYIHIGLKTEKDKVIFTVANSKPRMAFSKDQVGGIGVKNVQQRLNLLYPDKHKLQIEDSDIKYAVHLEIDCT